MTHNLASLYLSLTVSNISRYNLRNSSNLQAIDARTTLYYNSFLPSTVRDWSDSHKHLGLYFSHDCTWHQHINNITVKAWARINIMRKLKFKLDRKSLETIYTAFIRPLIEYGDIIWDNYSRYEKDELEKNSE